MLSIERNTAGTRETLLGSILILSMTLFRAYTNKVKTVKVYQLHLTNSYQNRNHNIYTSLDTPWYLQQKYYIFAKNITIKKDLWHELQNPLCKVIVMAFILSKFYCSVFCVLKSFQFLSRKFMYYKITQKAFSHKKLLFQKHIHSPHLSGKVKHTSYSLPHGTTTYQTH